MLEIVRIFRPKRPAKSLFAVLRNRLGRFVIIHWVPDELGECQSKLVVTNIMTFREACDRADTLAKLETVAQRRLSR